jgi:hypothetical protein
VELLVRRNPEGAAELVGEGALPELLRVDHDTLVRLLKSQDPRVRTAGIPLTGRMGE